MSPRTQRLLRDGVTVVHAVLTLTIGWWCVVLVVFWQSFVKRSLGDVFVATWPHSHLGWGLLFAVAFAAGIFGMASPSRHWRLHCAAVLSFSHGCLAMLHTCDGAFNPGTGVYVALAMAGVWRVWMEGQPALAPAASGPGVRIVVSSAPTNE